MLNLSRWVCVRPRRVKRSGSSTKGGNHGKLDYRAARAGSRRRSGWRWRRIGGQGCEHGQAGRRLGAVGGGVIGQILASALGAGDVAGMDVGTLVRDLVGGGVGGAVVMALIGALRNAMMKR